MKHQFYESFFHLYFPDGEQDLMVLTDEAEEQAAPTACPASTHSP
jgi:hypothetical protein